MPPVLRLLADDLTGALDSAARFVPIVGPVPVVWSAPAPAGSVAIDTGTRDATAAEAYGAMVAWRDAFDGADIAFKKVDSLLRGHVALELAACIAGFDRCVFAPAFPFQGRVTRRGRQFARDGNGWRPVGPDALPLPMRDAETEEDLRAVVASERARPGPILWIGTGGLAGALTGGTAVPCPTIPHPTVALIGSDHAITTQQIAQASASVVHLDPIRPSALTPPCIAVVDLPRGTERAAASRTIPETLFAALRAGPRPGSVFVTGGATLRALCDRMGIERLTVDGEIEPGVPTSIAGGGPWDGLRIVSKSGAFGDPDLLSRLFAGQ